jgi:hypothetical protein
MTKAEGTIYGGSNKVCRCAILGRDSSIEHRRIDSEQARIGPPAKVQRSRLWLLLIKIVSSSRFNVGKTQ